MWASSLRSLHCSYRLAFSRSLARSAAAWLRPLRSLRHIAARWLRSLRSRCLACGVALPRQHITMWATSLRSLARSVAAWLHPLRSLRRIARPATSHRIAPHRGSARFARFAAHTGRHSSSRSPARSAKRSCGVTPFAFLTLHLMRDGSTRFACSAASLAAPMTRSHRSLRAAPLMWGGSAQSARIASHRIAPHHI